MKLLNFKNFDELTSKVKTEKQAINYFLKLRWGNKINPVCPFCNKCGAYNFKNQNKTFKCKNCNKIYSYKTGTIFENTKIPMRKWFIAIYLFSSHKKGISSHQLSRDLSITQKTAWFMLQRIREVMKNDNNNSESGTFEADEAYIGGSETNKHNNKKGKDDKVCVFGIVNRNTKQVKAYKVSSNEKDVLLGKIYSNVKDNSTIFTDSYNGYDDLQKHYNHEFVKHCAGEYNRDKKDKDGRTAYKINTNSIEGFWSQLKRGIEGIYHWTSKKHIQRYINEFVFRYNTKNKDIYTEIIRFNCVLQNTLNKRLKYDWLIG